MLDFDYRGEYTYFITMSTKNKVQRFCEWVIVAAMIDALKDAADVERFAVDAYCFMPDHIHLLLRGLNERAVLTRFIGRFKQTGGYWFKKRHGVSLWQVSFYDHVLRKDEALRDVALYIFNNPLRKGLVKDFKEYPFSGSFTMDIASL
ncbi:MAG: transposase [Deltaproteobacteria bacterium]|nr:transposase [Deltaproteobacteria bacterium]